MNTHQLTDLSAQIEQLIQGHIAACRKVAQDALVRAFDGIAAVPTATARQATAATSTKAPDGAKKTLSQRRTRVEIVAASERFYEAVVANPGETMTFLATKLGVRAADLSRPMDLLRQAKRIRSIGRLYHTRYYPLCETDAPAAA